MPGPMPSPRSLSRRIHRIGGAIACSLTVAAAAPALASAVVSHAANFQPSSRGVFCGVALAVRGTARDPGTGAPVVGLHRGLQCSARGIPRPKGAVGDPFVQLGQGQAGRARGRA